jgi:RHS repeat-associated protein
MSYPYDPRKRFEATSDNERVIGCAARSVLRVPRSTPLGTITSLSNAAGALAQTYTFDSLGNQMASSGSLANPFQFTGREFDGETMLYFMRERYFDPASGRFISEDPIGFCWQWLQFLCVCWQQPN